MAFEVIASNTGVAFERFGTHFVLLYDTSHHLISAQRCRYIYLLCGCRQADDQKSDCAHKPAPIRLLRVVKRIHCMSLLVRSDNPNLLVFADARSEASFSNRVGEPRNCVSVSSSFTLFCPGAEGSKR